MNPATPGLARRVGPTALSPEQLPLDEAAPSRRQVVDTICAEARRKHVACPRWRAAAMLATAEQAVKHARSGHGLYRIRRPWFWVVHPVMEAVMADGVDNPPADSAHEQIHRRELRGSEFALIHTKDDVGMCVLEIATLSVKTIPTQAA